jgi:PAS domain S-box-containing protein
MLEQIKQLLEGSVDAAVVLDTDRRILYYNRAYEASTGLRGRQLAQKVAAGARCYEVFPLEICQTDCVGCRARDVGRAVRVDEIKAMRGDGEELTFIVAAVPVTLHDGTMVIIETYRDVTADVRIQRRLKGLLERERQAKQNLEEVVLQRTQELRAAHATLVHQEKMSSLGRLVAGIAHELNNPIGIISTRVELMLQDAAGQPLPAQVVEDLQVLRRNIQRVMAIAKGLLSFARHAPDESQAVDVNAVIVETVLLLGRPLGKDGVQVATALKPSLGAIWGNGNALQQVVTNLLLNARDAMPRGGEVRIVTEADPDRAGSLRLTIADTGDGMRPEALARIWEPFYTTKTSGTGLGLVMARRIIEEHGGTVDVRSEAGRGTTFTIVLPLHAIHAAS